MRFLTTDVVVLYSRAALVFVVNVLQVFSIVSYTMMTLASCLLRDGMDQIILGLFIYKGTDGNESRSIHLAQIPIYRAESLDVSGFGFQF